MDWSDRPELTDEELIRRLDAVHGHAVVAFKNPDSPRTVESARIGTVWGYVVTRGTRHAVSAAAIRAALEDMRALPVAVVEYFTWFGAAHVIAEPEAGPVLRQEPYVDFLVPRYSLPLADREPAPRC